MNVILAHRVRLVPTAEQELYFVQASGVARFAYNWALAEWRRQNLLGAKPSEAALRKVLNAVKDEKFPWMRKVTKNAPQQAVKNLGKAYANFFCDLAKYRRGEIARNRVRVPRFKKKGRYDRFRADDGSAARRPDAVKTFGKCVRLPLIGWVKMREEVRFAGRILSVVIARQADAWYASFSVEVPFAADVRSDRTVVGVDLGLRTLATLSDGSIKFPAPKPLRMNLAKVRRLSRSLARKKHHSNNRDKAKVKLARLYRKISNIRCDALHKLTSYLVRYRSIVIEDLNISEMLENRQMSRAIADVGFFEFRRQLLYKSAMASSTVVVADRWYPSSKLCSTCGTKNEDLTLSERHWICLVCGTSHDRDENAALNLARYPEGSPGTAHGAEGTGVEDHLDVEPAA